MAIEDDALDLSPRDAVPAAPSVRSRKRRWKPALLLAVILVFGGSNKVFIFRHRLLLQCR
jgi:hypothetical protein